DGKRQQDGLLKSFRQRDQLADGVCPLTEVNVTRLDRAIAAPVAAPLDRRVGRFGGDGPLVQHDGLERPDPVEAARGDVATIPADRLPDGDEGGGPGEIHWGAID